MLKKIVFLKVIFLFLLSRELISQDDRLGFGGQSRVMSTAIDENSTSVAAVFPARFITLSFVEPDPQEEIIFANTGSRSEEMAEEECLLIKMLDNYYKENLLMAGIQLDNYIFNRRFWSMIYIQTNRILAAIKQKRDNGWVVRIEDLTFSLQRNPESLELDHDLIVYLDKQDEYIINGVVTSSLITQLAVL